MLFDGELIAIIPAETVDIHLDGPLIDERVEPQLEEGDDLPQGETIDRTHDPMRLYLREMGSVPLLNREGEIAVARRIERGQNRTRRALSRCPVAHCAFVRRALSPLFQIWSLRPV